MYLIRGFRNIVTYNCFMILPKKVLIQRYQTHYLVHWKTVAIYYIASSIQNCQEEGELTYD
jgi:hypothetical protein